MDAKKWEKVCIQLQPNLEAILKIVEENEIDYLGMSVFAESNSYSAFMIDTKTKEQFHFSVSDGKTFLNYEPVGGSQHEKMDN